MTAATTAFLDVAVRIRDDILCGALRSGDRLKLDELAVRYGIGHTPVREALRQLQGERLVEMTPNCGARVRPMDLGIVRNMFDVRMALDALLARRAAELINREQLESLHELQRTMLTQVRRRDYASVIAANRAFHRQIGEAANNGEAVEILERHWQSIPALWRSVGYAPERYAQVIDDHMQILDAIERRDADAASCLAMAHVAKAKHQLLARMSAGELSRSASHA